MQPIKWVQGCSAPTAAPLRTRTVAVTHSHGDHTGGLPLLLDAYPKVPVVFYELEAPYLVPDDAGRVQQLVASDTLLARVLRWVGMLAQQPVTVSAPPVACCPLPCCQQG